MLMFGAWQSAVGIKDSSRVFQSEHFFLTTVNLHMDKWIILCKYLYSLYSCTSWFTYKLAWQAQHNSKVRNNHSNNLWRKKGKFSVIISVGIHWNIFNCVRYKLCGNYVKYKFPVAHLLVRCFPIKLAFWGWSKTRYPVWIPRRNDNK